LREKLMPVREELIAEIEAVISSAASEGYERPSDTNDVYENYVWALCLLAAERNNAAIRFETVREVEASKLIFRTSPGAIYSTTQDFTHAVLEFPDCPPLEVHVGVKVTGISRVLHECDVAVLDRSEAQLCRLEQVHPRASKVLIAAECKFYASAIQLNLGRGFLGLTSDIHRKERYFVTNARPSNATKLIAYHQSEWECTVLPNSPESDALLHSIARAIRNYRASF
jgi:hypothetical protein